MGDDFVRQVYEASYRRLVGQLYGVCGDLGEAEEVVEEAFARAIQHERKFQRTDNPEASLRTVAVNLSRSRWRRRILGERLQRASHRTRGGSSPRLPAQRRFRAVFYASPGWRRPTTVHA
jgi:RNA polymerase sigma-70 factor, ECF subfamily